MDLQRRHMFLGGLGVLTAGGASIGAKSLGEWLSTSDLKGPQTDLDAVQDPSDAEPASRSVWAKEDVRRAYVHNLHTGEMLNAVYFVNGRYVPGVLAAAKHILRDWRNGQQHFIDPHLFDLLHTLRGKIETNRPFQILSGYRSPATNAMLHAESDQVASRSQHLLGKALDITVEGVGLTHLHRAALSLRAGGVGYYPESGFVHVDVGRVREWTGA